VKTEAFFQDKFANLVDIAQDIISAPYKDGVLYDLAININSSDTESHVDEYAAERPGGFIVSMIIVTPGVSYFQGDGCDDPKHCDVTLPNTMAGFGSSLRVEYAHVVYVLQESSEPLAYSVDENMWKQTGFEQTGIGETRRVTVTVRFGARLTPAQVGMFDELWQEDFDEANVSTKRAETRFQAVLKKSGQLVIVTEKMEQVTSDLLGEKPKQQSDHTVAIASTDVKVEGSADTIFALVAPPVPMST
jgi:hypothetical protein